MTTDPEGIFANSASNGSSMDLARITIDDLDAVMAKVRHLKLDRDTTEAFRMNSATKAKVLALCTPSEARAWMPYPDLLAPLAGIEIHLDETLPDDICEPCFSDRQRRALHREGLTPLLPRTFQTSSMTLAKFCDGALMGEFRDTPYLTMTSATLDDLIEKHFARYCPSGWYQFGPLRFHVSVNDLVSPGWIVRFSFKPGANFHPDAWPKHPSTPEILHANIALYKPNIRNGMLVDGPRGSGRTTALLEVIHDDHDGHALVGLPSQQILEYTRTAYVTNHFEGKASFRDLDRIPRFFVISKNSAYRTLHGLADGWPIFVENYDMVSVPTRQEFELELDGTPAGSW